VGRTARRGPRKKKAKALTAKIKLARGGGDKQTLAGGLVLPNRYRCNCAGKKNSKANTTKTNGDGQAGNAGGQKKEEEGHGAHCCIRGSS